MERTVLKLYSSLNSPRLAAAWLYFRLKLGNANTHKEAGGVILDAISTRIIRSFALALAAISFFSPLRAQELSHRKADVTLTVQTIAGEPLPNATIDLQMTRHQFTFGSQIRDRLFSISQEEFDSLTETGKQALLPNLTKFGQDRYTPTWQDVADYRTVVSEQFNHVVPTVGTQWISLNQNGPDVPDAAISQAQSAGLGVTGASVVWQRDRWPTPEEFRPEANPDPLLFYNTLISDRLSEQGILARFSSDGEGPDVRNWKLLNEPLNERYFVDTFVGAGFFNNEVALLTDYFLRAESIRPDAQLSINEFNILNSGNDNATIAYRDLIQDLLDNGAPIDLIGIQAHMSRNDVSKADMVRRLNILAETGLPIEISEFDTRDDAEQLTPAQQQRIFRDLLEASFEHPAVNGFIMWGFWDPGHWRGNGPLFDETWNIKPEAAPWFDLVRGDWMPVLSDLQVDENGQWISPEGLFLGRYDFTVNLNGQSYSFQDYEITEDGEITLEIDPPTPPLGFKLLDGIRFGGGLADIQASDDTRLQIDPSPTANLVKQKIDLYVVGSSLVREANQLEFRVETRMSGGPAGPVMQAVYLINQQTRQKELVDFRSVSNDDQSISVRITNNPQRFINQINGDVIARVEWRTNPNGPLFFWSVDIDETRWIIE